MRKAAAAALCAVIVGVLLPAAASAHPGALDSSGGHICRPGGGGVADCTSVGLVPGEYTCHQEPCIAQLQRLKERWCVLGFIVPVRPSEPRGESPTGPVKRVIRVDRRAVGHTLVTDRRLTPDLVAPSDCQRRDPAFRVSSTGFEVVQPAAQPPVVPAASLPSVPVGPVLAALAMVAFLWSGVRLRPVSGPFWQRHRA